MKKFDKIYEQYLHLFEQTPVEAPQAAPQTDAAMPPCRCSTASGTPGTANDIRR